MPQVRLWQMVDGRFECVCPMRIGTLPRMRQPGAVRRWHDEVLRRGHNPIGQLHNGFGWALGCRRFVHRGGMPRRPLRICLGLLSVSSWPLFRRRRGDVVVHLRAARHRYMVKWRGVGGYTVLGGHVRWHRIADVVDAL